ncbi:MAG: hypothetical protein JW971_07830 [Synergistales bacterium]|nr:hypothetical protein [Synergistales bacterium]
MRIKSGVVTILALCLLLLFASASVAEIPPGWEKVGDGGLVDGIPTPPYTEKPARNNSYAWSMGTLQCSDDLYLYIGAYRNFPHGSFLGPMSPFPIDSSLFGDSIPPEETWDLGTVEIMRKNITDDGAWEVVPLTPYVGAGDLSGNQGFRKMYSYKDVLYAGTMNMKMASQGWDGVPRLLAISNCLDEPEDVTPPVVSADLEENKAYSYRGMVEHDGVFYVAYEYGVFASEGPPDWSRLSDDGIEGYITDLVSFQGSLWAVTSDGEEGWRLFRWEEASIIDSIIDDDDSDCIEGSWIDETPGLKQAVHVGANGFVYDDHLYIGTLNGGFPLYDVDLLNADITLLLERMLKVFVPSYLYRFDGEEWETVMGNGIGLKGPGFGVPSNVYLWTQGFHDGDLYISTFDYRSMFYAIDWEGIELFPTGQNVLVDTLKTLVSTHIKTMCEMAGIELPAVPSLNDIVHAFITHGTPVGFDLFRSEDGVNFEPVMQDGFGDTMQYGGRTMLTTRENCKDILWLGTANPGNGCQVWRYEKIPLATETEGFFPDPDGIRYTVSVTPCSEEDNGEVSGDIRETLVDVASLLAGPATEDDSVFFELELLASEDICAVEICVYPDEADNDWLPDTQPNLWWHDGEEWNELAVTWTDLGDGQWKACVELPEESWGAVFGAALDDSIFESDGIPGGADDDDDHDGGSGCNIGTFGPLIMLILIPLGLLWGKIS